MDSSLGVAAVCIPVFQYFLNSAALGAFGEHRSQVVMRSALSLNPETVEIWLGSLAAKGSDFERFIVP